MGKRTLFIGDIHGNDGWRKIAGEAIYCNANVVFLGDYVDSFDIDPWLIFENLKDIVEFKKKNDKRVNLLLGNHDYAYVFGKTAISGHNHHMAINYRQVINDNWKYFDLAWGITSKEKYTLVTHAGLTTWFYSVLEFVIEDKTNIMYDVFKDIKWKELPLHELINYFKDQSSEIWRVGRERGGVDKTGGILWADKSELTRFHYPGIDQVVGHTPCRWIEQRTSPINGDKLYFIDSYQNAYISSLMLEF